MPNIIRKMEDQYAEYLKDESRSVGEAASISFPKTQAEVLETMRNCLAKGEKITVQGSRTGLAASAVPHGGHILNLSRLNHILGLRYDAPRDNFFVTVEPGVLLSQLRKAVADKSFDIKLWNDKSVQTLEKFRAAEWFFTPDPTETSASIGGMVSCNASGARTFLFGPTRNYIEALRVILPNGEVLNIRRGRHFAKERKFKLKTENNEISGDLPSYIMPEVKSAAGYFVHDNMDLIDLFIGAEGTLGVITQIEVRLIRLPKAIWGITAFFPNEPSALEYVKALRNENKKYPWLHRPAAIEFFNCRALDLLRSQKANNPAFAQIQELKPQYHTAVYTELHGHSVQAEEMPVLIGGLGDLINFVGGDEADTWVANNQRDLEKLQFFRHAMPESANMLIDQRRKLDPTLTKLGTDMSVPDRYLNTVMEMYNRDLAEADLENVIFGHIGNNHLHVNILPRNKTDYLKGKELYLKWAQINVANGGSVAAEHGIGKLKTNMLEVMYGASGINEMRRLKSLFDPNGLINCGNMFAPAKEVK